MSYPIPLHFHYEKTCPDCGEIFYVQVGKNGGQYKYCEKCRTPAAAHQRWMKKSGRVKKGKHKTV